ncbi:hypothetical protein BC938DRAFT_477907 [Jimgerdemannia flammicorona]|uniref:Uncharacterized protein n=1 Tax=Jimgerdemannia flammicorona TaxID=994334 RepID=A0A433QNQ5_9FUNG|nr:hypothetical protein BC938DRAFT_477907 [Jimgerdemannia flammicorona]
MFFLGRRRSPPLSYVDPAVVPGSSSLLDTSSMQPSLSGGYNSGSGTHPIGSVRPGSTYVSAGQIQGPLPQPEINYETTTIDSRRHPSGLYPPPLPHPNTNTNDQSMESSFVLPTGKNLLWPQSWRAALQALPFKNGISSEQLSSALRKPGQVQQVVAAIRKGAGDLSARPRERALVISEVVFGSDHPNTAKSLGSLAGLYMGQGKYNKPELQLNIIIDFIIN